MQVKSHLSVLIHDLANKYGDKTALTFKKFGSDKWQSVSWNQFSLRVKQVSNALLNIGAKPHDKIAVFSQNCVHYLYTDFGAYGIKVCSIPFYATSSEQQIQYMINDGQVRFLFVGEQDQYDKAHRVFALCPSLERVSSSSTPACASVLTTRLPFTSRISSSWARTCLDRQRWRLCISRQAWMIWLTSFIPVVLPVTARESC